MSTALVRQSPNRALVSRRGFLKRAAAAVIGVAATKLLPAPALQFASDAFAQAFGHGLSDGVMRFDVLFGFKVLRSDLACRIVDADETIDYTKPAIDVQPIRSEAVRDDSPLTIRVVRQWTPA